MREVLVPLFFVLFFTAAILFLQARVAWGHYVLGSWKLIRMWQVHVNNSREQFVLTFMADNRRALKHVYWLKTHGWWTPDCYLSWQLQLLRHGHIVKSGRVHILRMQPKMPKKK